MSGADQKEIENFSKDAGKWWDANGPFRPLHRLNPVRLGYIKQQVCAHFGRDEQTLNSYEGLSFLDIGCGGGLVCEPLVRLGGSVTGVDADEKAIAIARNHASDSGLEIDYRAITVEEVDTQYDVVLALEIIEHVPDPEAFVQAVVARCKPGGLIIFSTLNRNAKSFALGIVAAEYMLRWVPRGTHNWKKFIKPSELSRMLRSAGAKPTDLCGLAFDPLKGEFHMAKNDLDVNYFLTAERA
jgi:2-polyprenyl-6-hydroxyphenyl methylase/3-demethylubiquinone-9 3-methyltransferase